MTKQKRTPNRSGNEGIQADSVKADVLAVGRGAKALKIVKSDADILELAKAISELRKELEKLNMNGTARAAVEEDIAALETEAGKRPSDPQEMGNLLQRIAGKLKMVGVVVTEVGSLSESMRKLAELVGLSLKSLGLL